MKRLVPLLLPLVASAATLTAQTSSPPREITVYAAASLTDAMIELGELAEKGGARTRVRYNVKLIVGAEAVPIGKYTREMLRRLERHTGFPPSYGGDVLANVVSQEENVKGVVAKVQLGEADAGIVYRSDVTSRVAPSLTVLEIPDEANVVASYPVAVLRTSADSAAAAAFVALLLGPEGRRVLARHGLTPAETTP